MAEGTKLWFSDSKVEHASGGMNLNKNGFSESNATWSTFSTGAGGGGRGDLD